MLENKIKRALNNDQAVFGIGLTGRIEISTLRTLAGCEVEWLFLDIEHGSTDISDLVDAVQVADLLGMSSVMRVPSLDYHWVTRSLDTGALSVMIPRVESKDQAELAVDWAKFPPIGTRGMGSPSYLGYAPVTPAEGVEISNRETMVVLQIESTKAIEEIEAIASVPEVDALFLGPLDMSISLGKPGDVAGEESHRLFRHVCRVAREHGLATGTVCRSDQVRYYYDMGMRMFSIGTALSHLCAAVQATAAEFREQLSDRR
jgi:2-keto-3-deoxy-L-rhamnonate aldolase RhmA